jgi:hypothetical protein
VTPHPETFDAFQPWGTLPFSVTQTGCVSVLAPGLNAPESPQAPETTIGTISAPAAQPAGVPVDVVVLVVVAVVVVAVLEVVVLVRELVDEVPDVPLALEVEVEVALLPLVVAAVDVVLTPLVRALVVLEDVEPAVYVPVLPAGVLVALVVMVLLTPGVMSAAALGLGESPGSAAHAKNWMTGSTKTACFKQRRRLIGGRFPSEDAGATCARRASAYELYRGTFAAHVP